ncbi:MAG: DUF2269 family protein [Gammaproteobacteria bacterium]
MKPYFIIKTLHIVSASFFLVGSCLALWPLLQTKNARCLRPLTGYVILPLGFIQLLTGFTLISLQHYDFSHLWIKVSLLGFLCLCISWLGLLIADYQNKPWPFLQRNLSVFIFCNVLTMVFFMANRLG